MDIKDLLFQTYIRLRADSKDKANMLTAATKGDEFRESNRLKYRSGSGPGSRNFIFNGSVPVQVQDFSKIWVQVRFGFSCIKI